MAQKYSIDRKNGQKYLQFILLLQTKKRKKRTVDGVTVCSLASGSNGNVYYIESDGTAIVVDMGISFRKLKNRAMTRQVDLRKIKAVFVSHEHSDHVYGLPTFCEQLGIEVYMTAATQKAMRQKYCPRSAWVRHFTIGEDVNIGPFTVSSFSKPHDVVDPSSFRIETKGISIGVFTDIGAKCEGLTRQLSQCHLAFLESNYDKKMLWSGHYPQHLKKRIVSGKGHLSNDESAEIVSSIESTTLHTLFLSHISADNNTTAKVREAFAELEGRYHIEVMSRMEASDIWSVTESETVKVSLTLEIPERLDRVPLRVK